MKKKSRNNQKRIYRACGFAQFEVRKPIVFLKAEITPTQFGFVAKVKQKDGV